MKKMWLLALIVLSFGVNAQIVTIFSEGFEGGYFPPNGWLQIDGDGDGKNWLGQNNINYSHTGSYFAKSFSKENSVAYTPNNWLITPIIQLNSGVIFLKFWIAGSAPSPEERFKIVVSETNPADTTTFSPALYSETLQNENWKEITVNLTPYAGKEVSIGFVHYKCTSQYYLRLDDILVTSQPDTELPTITDNSQSTFPVNQEAAINVVVSDYSPIQSVDMYYRINNGGLLTKPMSYSNGVYSAIVPGQANGVKVTYYVVAKDIANNTTTTTTKEITWAYNQWFGWGTVYDNYGCGIFAPSAPSHYWKAATDFDFGNNTYKIRKIVSSMLFPENCMWKFTEFNNIPLPNQLGDLVGFVDFTGNYSNDTITVNSNTIVTSKFALVINSLGNWMQMDQQGPDNHTFIADGDGVFKLLTTLPGASEIHGSWNLKIYAEDSNVGITNYEFIPGEIRLANYPNPFNPTTTIKFFNNCTGNVNLTVYNYKGEVVKELINSQVASGEHSIIFDGSRLSSGVYFYKLTTPVKSLTGRMLMLK